MEHQKATAGKESFNGVHIDARYKYWSRILKQSKKDKDFEVKLVKIDESLGSPSDKDLLKLWSDHLNSLPLYNYYQ